ncbi:MAG: hypothetical protein ACYTAN_08310 [Planctomycetota bacterium]
MSQLESEPIFCSECQNEITVAKARMLGGRVLCPADLAKRSFLDRLRARRLPQDYRRRTGKVFQSLFASMAALMIVIGIVFIVKGDAVAPGARMPAPGVNREGDTAANEGTTAAAPLWEEDRTEAGVVMIVAGALVAIGGMFAGDVIDLLLDIRYQQRQQR